MAQIPQAGVTPRIRETQVSPSGAAFAAANRGIAIQRQGVQDMAAALGKYSERVRVTQRQQAEIDYKGAAQDIVDLATKAKGANAAGAVDQAKKDLEDLRDRTLKSSWGTSGKEMSITTEGTNLAGQGLLLAHARTQQEVADKVVAANGLEQSGVAVSRTDVEGMVPVAVDQAFKNVNDAKERYLANTGYAMPKAQQELMLKAFVGELTMNGFIQKFAEDPVSAMDAWDETKDKLRGMMDAKNYAALEAKTEKHRSQVAYIRADRRYRSKFTDKATGYFDAAAASVHVYDSANWKTDRHLTPEANLKLAGVYSQLATKDRQQEALVKAETQETHMKVLMEVLGNNDFETAQTMLESPEFKDNVSFAYLQAAKRMMREGEWTGDDHNSLVFDILVGDVKTNLGIAGRINREANSLTYTGLLERLNAKTEGLRDKWKDAGLPNNFTAISSMIKQQVYASAKGPKARAELLALWETPIRNEIITKWMEADMPSVYAPATRKLIRETIGTFDKIIIRGSGNIEERPDLPFVFDALEDPFRSGEIVTGPTGLIGTNTDSEVEAAAKAAAKAAAGVEVGAEKIDTSALARNLEVSPEQAARQISVAEGKDYDAVLKMIIAIRGGTSE